MTVLVLALGPFGASALAADGTAHAVATDVPPADITSAVLSGDSDASAIVGSLGVVVPFTPPDLLLLSTGEAGSMSVQPGQDLGPIGEAGDRTTLALTVQAPIDAYNFSVRVNFFSAEYPEFVGSQFNDKFNINVTGSAWTGDASKDDQGRPISVNSAFFGVTSAEALDGTGFDADLGYYSYYPYYYDYYSYGSGLVGGATGWLQVVVPVTPGEPVQIEYVVRDIGDGSYDSTVAIDDFRWGTEPLDDPTIIAPPAIDWLSPKRGPVAGGTVTEIRGRNFDATCFAVLGGVVADETVFIDSHHLQVTTPPHDVGQIDVRVDCEDGETALNGAFTYYDVEPDGVTDIHILEVEPYQLPLAGGEVALTVEGLTPGATVRVDTEAVPVVEIDATHLSFTAPVHLAGTADVEVTLQDGRTAYRPGALFYVDVTERVPDDTGPGYDTDTPGGCGCASTGLSGGLFAGLFGVVALLARRRAGVRS